MVWNMLLAASHSKVAKNVVMAPVSRCFGAPAQVAERVEFGGDDNEKRGGKIGGGLVARMSGVLEV